MQPEKNCLAQSLIHRHYASSVLVGGKIVRNSYLRFPEHFFTLAIWDRR